MRKSLPIMLGIGTLIALGACSGPSPKPITLGPSSPVPASSTAAPVTAATILDKFRAAGLPMTNVATQDEATDPNSLLGRPNSYTSHASFDLPGGDPDGTRADVSRGGVIEVFPDASKATVRASYIRAVTAGDAFLAEYDYQDGPVLLRITGKVTPSTAKQFQAALTK